MPKTKESNAYNRQRIKENIGEANNSKIYQEPDHNQSQDGPTNLKDIHTKFNLFVSKLCLTQEAKNYLFVDTYKAKMSQILRSAPDISLYKDVEIPEHLREVAILTGYRSPSSSIKECAVSVFFATNETLNFWTHFIPTFYFIYQLLDFQNVIADSYYWPFVMYMSTVCLYPMISALAHTFCSISDMARHIWFFLDYGGLCLYAFGAGLLTKAYAFPHELSGTVMDRYFQEILVFLVIAGTISACFSRFLDNLALIKLFRLGAFALPWMWDQIPVIYRLNYSLDLDPAAAEHYNLQFFYSFGIGFFYASHLPERLAPGKFDFLGNSHQLLHISGIMATHHQMNAAIIDMRTRQTVLQEKYPFPNYLSLHVFFLVCFSIITTIVVFVLWARHYEKNREDLKRNN